MSRLYRTERMVAPGKPGNQLQTANSKYHSSCFRCLRARPSSRRCVISRSPSTRSSDRLSRIVLLVRARASEHSDSVVLLGLVFLALQVDALGNYFRMYGRQFGPMQYDEFSHMMVQVLVSPDHRLAHHRLLQQFGYRLPLKLTAFFAATIVFSLSAIYEIIELWDEIYFGGQRIWGPYDTATDLQWDLCGIIVGTLFSCIMLRDTRDQLVPH